MESRLNKLKHNHSLMMVICCGVPLIILMIAVNYFSLNNKYLTWSIILLCPAMHFFMMKDMHKKHSDARNKEESTCH